MFECKSSPYIGHTNGDAQFIKREFYRVDVTKLSRTSHVHEFDLGQLF